jgi:hypothetical protein
MIGSSPRAYMWYIIVQRYGPSKQLDSMASSLVLSTDLGQIDGDTQAIVDHDIRRFLEDGGELRVFHRVSKSKFWASLLVLSVDCSLS